MLLKILSRIGIFVVTLFAASLLIFAFMNFLPGNPAQVALGINADPESVAALEEKFGLNRPWPERYFEWIGGLLQGDFGRSWVGDFDLTPEIVEKFNRTLVLVLCGMVIAIVIAIPLGIVMAVRHGKPSGLVLSVLSQIGVAIPAFVLALILINFLALRSGWFLVGGYTAPQDDFVQFLRQITLPALSLGLVQGAVLSRYVRSAILDVLRTDYLRTARAKGLTPYRAIVKHGLRNASIPVVTVLGLQLATLLVGAVVIERVFVIPGLGDMLLNEVANRDLIGVQSIVMLLVTLTLFITLLVELLYVVLDPRLRTNR
ncbi:ABC transporter permease subunit [Epidermidibacterium keratini]|uniref:ABC transporter permease subunit n=1 Tax=Epidermidibacterium keratini TaxID=1891644 RepID=A0A7L4YNU7_9ACTN|nr:ABC transporter permease [Epidermidibacterium keratini]QHC00544.1 ABC transporter permease subunit [Epidermidibacterium keratini]